MAISEEARLEMYKRFEEVLGMPAASTLMEHLPHEGWDRFATKQDLLLLESRLESKIEHSCRDVQRNLFFGLLTAQTTIGGLLYVALQAAGG